MPNRFGVIQMALGALCTVAFIISNSFGSGDSKQKRVVGIVQRTGNQTFRLTEDNARQHTFHLAESASVFLNEREVAFSTIENGRKASVQYRKEKRENVATKVELFPTREDFEEESGKEETETTESTGATERG